jgi:hypothetical protein
MCDRAVSSAGAREGQPNVLRGTIASAILAVILPCTALAQEVPVVYTLVTSTFVSGHAPVVASVGLFDNARSCVWNAKALGEQLDGPHHRLPLTGVPEWQQNRVVLQCLPSRVPDGCGRIVSCTTNDVAPVIVFLQ